MYIALPAQRVRRTTRQRASQRGRDTVGQRGRDTVGQRGRGTVGQRGRDTVGQRGRHASIHIGEMAPSGLPGYSGSLVRFPIAGGSVLPNEVLKSSLGTKL